jgi:hypothetical protein
MEGAFDPTTARERARQLAEGMSMLPIFERVCRWTCGTHAGKVVTDDGSVALAGGRSVTPG